jgi:glycosyltransferase involved in cell wall biosynthesis
MPLKVLIVSGIWPPDVGGPASHGPELGRFLQSRGHDVRAVTSAGQDGPRHAGFPLRSTNRERRLAVRLATGAAAVAVSASGTEVIYATGMYARSALVASGRRIPLVMKLVNDPAYDRARSLGVFSGSLEEFQHSSPGGRVRALKALRGWTVDRASRIVIPSEYFAEIARGWGVPPDRITVVPNPAPSVPPSGQSRDELRRRLGLRGFTFVFAGRLVAAKNLPLAVRALGKVPDASLVILGEGPELPAVEEAVAAAGVAERVSLAGPRPRPEVIEWLRAADAAILPSDFENFPHAAVEALAAGTPVVATSVGGVPEIVESGVNGLLVPPGNMDALAEAMRAVTGLERMREAALASSRRYVAEVTFAAIEHELQRAVAGR